MTDHLTENARLRAALDSVIASYDRSNPMRTADMHLAACRCLRCTVDEARAALTTPAPDAVQEAARVPEIAALIEKADRIANWTIGNMMADDPENLEKYPHLAGAILDLRTALRAIAGGQP